MQNNYFVERHSMYACDNILEEKRYCASCFWTLSPYDALIRKLIYTFEKLVRIIDDVYLMLKSRKIDKRKFLLLLKDLRHLIHF